MNGTREDKSEILYKIILSKSLIEANCLSHHLIKEYLASSNRPMPKQYSLNYIFPIAVVAITNVLHDSLQDQIFSLWAPAIKECKNNW